MNFQASEKFRRMKVAYENLRAVTNDAGTEISNSQAKEATEEFFNHCYHFKDYLIREFPHLRQDIEKHITARNALSLAADYCNACKHAGIDKKPRSGQHFETVLQHTKLKPTASGYVWSADVEIRTTAGKSYRACELAEECIRDWSTLLQAHQIPIS